MELEATVRGASEVAVARVRFTWSWGKEHAMEYIRVNMPDGEELVLMDETEANNLFDADPRRTSLRMRRDAVAAQFPSTSLPTTTGH